MKTGLFVIAFLAAPALAADEPGCKQHAAEAKEIAGTAEFLRNVPKRYGTLKAVDPVRRQVTLLVEGETLSKVWDLVPDAELKVAGWWGRLDQFQAGERVWAWFKTDRQRQAVAISMLADELSEQDLHGAGVVLAARDGSRLTLQPAKGASRQMDAAKATCFRGAAPVELASFTPGSKVYVQTADGRARLVLDAAAFAQHQAQQRGELRRRWLDAGLPGTVTFLHVFSGELDFMLDHEAMRWGRALAAGAKVTLQAVPPIQAVVKHVQSWRERTEVRLVVNSFEQADLRIGERLALRMPAPPASVEDSPWPADLGQPRPRADRIEWFLASTYCSCGIGGDGCTGHFYTLASCNPNTCGMPRHMRQWLAARIDQGLSDEQIFEALVKDRGKDAMRPHLMP